MPQQLLSVSRAVRLTGVSRAALQRKILDNELPTFEGKIALTDLLRLFPDAQVEDSQALEKVQRIKTLAAPGRHEKVESAIPEVIARRINSMSEELVESRQRLHRQSQCADELMAKLAELATQGEAELRAGLEALKDWVCESMQRPLEGSEARKRLLVRDAFLRILAAHIKVIPSGHDFWVEGNESLLNASLRAGLHVNYGCSSGACGACKARVVSGEVHKLRDGEYELSETERNLGYILMCSYTAATDLTLEAGEASGVEDLPLQTIPARLDRWEALNDATRLLQLRTPPTQTLRFLAGQGVTLTLDGVRGALPLASCPCDGEVLQFHVRNGEQPLAARLFADAKPGLELTVEGPTGRFVLQEDASEPILLLAWETGFAPCKSMVEHAIAMDLIEGYHLEWFAADDQGVYLENLCRAWDDALDNFSYAITLTSQQTLGQALRQRLDELGPLGERQVYVSGPAFFVEAAKAVLRAKEMRAEQIHSGILE